MKRIGRRTQSDEEETLDLVEQTMKKVAAEPDVDFALLSRLDTLRAQVRQTLTRRRRRAGRV
jgi:hypothetical protein